MIKIFDSGYRGECPLESAELKTFFNQVRHHHPHTYGAIAYHPRNEGKKSAAQVTQEKMEGSTTGACDIIIPGGRAFVCELKRTDRTKSRVTGAELNYLEACDKVGAFSCVAYGWAEAWRAFNEYLEG